MLMGYDIKAHIGYTAYIPNKWSCVVTRGEKKRNLAYSSVCSMLSH